MKLYAANWCPYCRLVMEKLQEMGLEYELIDVPRERSSRTEVIKVSGQPLIPVLVDGDQVIDDEERIIAYLQETYAE